MDRRTFLASLGATLLLPRVARAQSQHAQRLIVFFSPNGTVHRHWRPTGAGNSYGFAPGSILEPLAGLEQKLIVLDGLDFIGATNHEGGMAAMLTGRGSAATVGGGASVDQFIASQLGTMERFPSLELSAQTSAWGGGVQTRMCYANAGTFVSPSDDPREVHRRLFGAAGASADMRSARRRAILDLNRAEIGDLSRKLGNDEKDKLDIHLASLRQMEASLAAAQMQSGACTAPMLAGTDSQSNDVFPAVTTAQIELLVAALACSMTRVASLQLSHTISPTVPSWLSISEGHHSLSHMDDSNTAGVAQFVQAERWFAGQFKYLVDRLEALPEPGGMGSMLDHSIVVWAKEMGDSRAHDCLSVPFVIAGGASGRLKLGQYLKLNHVPHTRLLVSLCQAMGVEVESFGDGGAAGRGPLEGLTT